MKGRKQQREDDCNRNRKNERQPVICTRLILKLTAPLDLITSGQLEGAIHLLLSQSDEASQIRSSHIRLNRHPPACVLARNYFRARNGSYLSHLIQPDQFAPWRSKYDFLQNFGIVSQRFRQAD